MAKAGKVSLFAEGDTQVALFKGREIRRVFHDDEWYFSIIDVVEGLTDSANPRRYWSDLKRNLAEDEGFVELYEEFVQLRMPSADGKERQTDAANTETIFRIIQSIPSKKAEVFKRWLAKVGYERILEYQNPEIAIKRAIMTYQLAGRPDDWIDARIKSILSRKEVTSEWARRGVREGEEYAILTNIISQETFDFNTKEHAIFKSLKKHHNLRDHMTNTELVLTMLGETSTVAIAKNIDARGFTENKEASRDGGRVAGNARKDLEKRLGRSVVSKKNFLPKSEEAKELDHRI